MPPTAKQYKTKSPKTGSDTSGKETDESPAKLKVISGQLQRSMRKKRKVRKGKGPVNSTRGVVFVKNLPHGFFEEQLQKYFQQFGKVTKVRLARSLKTGGSKGFAFIEFAIPEVAEIAADTMNNYLMFRKIVKAAYIPPEEQKYNYFRTSLRKVQNKHGKEMYVSAATKRTTKKVIEMNNWTAENYAKRMKRTHSKLNALKRNLSHLGYDADSVVLQTENSPVKDDIATTNGSTAPVSKKQKRSKSTSGESNHSSIQNTDTEPSPAKSTSAITSDKTTKEQSKIKLPVRPKAAGTLRRLLDSTIEDNSSSDDDFNPNEESVMTDESSEAGDSESAVYDHGLKLEKGKQNTLISLLNDTIPDEDSSDDEFDPANEINNLPIETSEEDDDDEETDADEEDDDETDEESSPSKTDKKFRKETERKLDKIGQKKVNGGVHKKVKVQKPVKSLALKQKIQESVKEMAKQNKVTKLKEKNLKKGKKRGL